MDFLPYGRQNITEEDITSVTETLQSDFLTCGPMVEAFEKEFARFVGAKHAVVVCNATAALDLAMRAGGIGPGDRVFTSPNTFLSSANCVAFVGATPDFSDISPDTYCLCPKSLERDWQPNTKAVIPVSYAGQSADMPAISEIARSKGALIVEDASHGAGGGFYHEGKAWKQGGHPWSDMTVFSFHPVKTLTTGEGGILVTDNDDYAAKARLLRTHGMSRDSEGFVGLGVEDGPLAEQGPWYYEMSQLGYNYRITDIQCALGLSQLKRLPDVIRRRQEIVAAYNQAFADQPNLTTPSTLRPEDAEHISWHLYTLRIDFEKLGKTRTEVINELREKGIGTQVLYIPVHLQPYYRQTYGYQVGKCPKAENYYAQALSLPLYPTMLDDDVQRVINEVCQLSQSSE